MTKKQKYFNPFVMKSLVMAGIFLIATGAAHAQFENWDSDRDAKISESEFSDGLFSQGNDDYGLFDGDDTNSRGVSELSFNDDQFYESSYGWWDNNDDQRLDESEWDRGYDNSFGDYLDDDFDAYDVDRDGYLDYDEYYNSVYDTDYYSAWDSNSDDVLDNDEYSNGLFDMWDSNDDNYVDENEYNDYNMW